MREIIFFFLTLFSVLTVSAQIIIYPSPNALLTTDMLSGPGVTISNLQINCNQSAYGIIDISGYSEYNGLGLILTNGLAENIIGPNNSGALGLDLSLPGDIDLNSMTGVTTFDACVIEFDISANDDTIYFYFMFGSEEYPEFVGEIVNDGFGVFVRGEGISGTFSDSAENRAQIPGTTVPVSVNTLNNGNNDCAFGGPNGPCSYCQFYINNCNGIISQYDGMTTLLQGIIPIITSSTYHVKLAIADGGDAVWDSGVIFPQASFRTTTSDFTGINENNNNNSLVIFPNPAKSEVNILYTSDSKENEIKIYNVQGQEIYCLRNFPTDRLTVDISSFLPGIYFLSISNSKQTHTKKFVKE